VRNARLGSKDLDGERILNKIQEDFLRSFFNTYGAAIDQFVRAAGKLIDRDDAVPAIVNLFRKEFGTKFPDAVYSDLATVMSDTWKLGMTFPVSADWSKAKPPKHAIEWFAKANHFDIGRTFPDYEEKIREAAVSALATGDNKKALRKLASEIPGVLDDERLRNRLGDVVRNMQNRAFTFSRVKGMEAAGITRAEIVAVIDDRTSAICLILDGKTFELRTVSTFIDEFISTEYDEAFWGKFRNPSFEPSKDEVQEAGSRRDAIKKKHGDLMKSSGDDVLKQLGHPTSPFHYKCRTLVIMSE